MFRNYLNNTNDDNGTENWSYPAGFERFNSVNIPRSRLGKRRTINTSSEVKRSILKGISSDNRTEKDEYKNLASKNSSLTHPVNSFSTPNYKKIDNSLDRSEENNDCDNNVNHLTPYRTIGSYPLKEVNNVLNEQNIISSNEKNSHLVGSLFDQQFADVKKISNKSLEEEKTINSTAQLHTFSTVNNGASHSDSSHSDFCNNSSFMTAHDVYNVEKNKGFHDYLKTPGKGGYGLFDTVASPLESLSTNTDDENDSLRKFLVKTPSLGHYDTPYRTQMRLDLFTPFKSKILTPVNSKGLDNVPEKDIELEEPYKQDCISRLENGIRTECTIGLGDASSLKGGDNKTIKKLMMNTKTNSPCSTPGHNFTDEPLSTFKKPSQSVEKLVKRQIFEGLGWTVPHSTFMIQSPVKETSSNVIQENLDVKIRNNLVDSVTNKDSGVRSDLNILKEPNIEINSNSNTASFKNSNDNKLEEPYPISSCDEKLSSAISKEERPFIKVDHSISKSTDSEVYTFINDDLSETKKISRSTYPSRTGKAVTDESNIIIPNMKNSVSGDIKDLFIKDKLPNKECTVVLNHSELEKKEVTENLNCKDTVIVKQSNTIELKSNVQEQIEKKKVIHCNQEKVVHGTPLFPNQTQIIRPPQANTIYVNKKPYTVLSMLGRGGSSEVYQVLDSGSSKLMALKFVNLSSVEDAVAKGYLNEIEVLSKLQGCSSVIKMFDSEYISENKILYVLMEKGDTDFSRLMKDITKTKKISMAMIIYYWTEMLNAVKDIHDKGIIHSDLKPANFLLVSGRLKLIDFGIASSLQGDMTSVLKEVTTGTFNYMSPETIRNSGESRGHKINYKSDIWSLGCILYNLLYGRTPFSHLTNTWSKLQAIADPETAVSFPSTSTAPPHLLLSVRWALTKDPKERPTAEELLKLAELTPGPETQLGRQISSLLGEYILQMFPNCRVSFEIENPKDKKQRNNFLN